MGSVYDATGGGLVLLAGSVSQTTFVNNLVRVWVGSLGYSGGGGLSCSNCTVSDCVFWGNRAEGGLYPGCGAALSAGGPEPVTITACTFVGNVATTQAPHPEPGFTEVAGVCMARGSVDRCLFVSNQGWCIDGTIATRCTNFWANTPSTGGRGSDAGGNFSADPLFCVLPDSTPDPRVQAASPCVAGNHPDGMNCGTIGAGTVGCTITAIRRATLGSLKSLYR